MYTRSTKRMNKGSITVEAALIVPSILMVVFLLLFSFLLMYQQSLLNKTASRAAELCAGEWNIRLMDYSGGQQFDVLYNRLFEESIPYSEIKISKDKKSYMTSISDEKFKPVFDIVTEDLSRSILKAKETTVGTEYSSSLVQKKIKVVLKQEITLPFSSLIEFFGGKSTITLSGTGTSVVTEPAEFIRNVDLVLNYADRLKGESNIRSIINGLKQRFLK